MSNTSKAYGFRHTKQLDLLGQDMCPIDNERSYDLYYNKAKQSVRRLYHPKKLRTLTPSISSPRSGCSSKGVISSLGLHRKQTWKRNDEYGKAAGGCWGRRRSPCRLPFLGSSSDSHTEPPPELPELVALGSRTSFVPGPSISVDTRG